MSKLSLFEIEKLAQKFRVSVLGVSLTEPLKIKSMLLKLNIITMYRPLSDNCYGISIKAEDAKFILVNCNSTIGRQHFTIAHELYHLFYDEHPEPHICKMQSTPEERNANLFASALLMPEEGLINEINDEETKSRKIQMSTIVRLEQMFGVSRSSMLIRLKDIGMLTKKQYDEYCQIPIKESASAYGYDLSLYEKGNKGVVIGDFGAKAHRLFEEDKISEGHYLELLNMLHYGEED